MNVLMNIVTNAEMAEIDRRAQEEFGYPELVLMENAGQNAYRVFLRWADLEDAPSDDRTRMLVFVAGSGNNGGDALVMARQAQIDGGHRVMVVTAKTALKGLAATHVAVCRALDIPVLSFADQRPEAESAIAEADFLIDGLAGTGIRGALSGSYGELVAAMNSAAAPIASVDAPSGVGDEFEPDFPSVYADLTISVELPKRALYMPEARRRCGEIRFCSAGFPPALTAAARYPGILLNHAGLPDYLPHHQETTYKTRRGVVAVYAGATGTAGAALLSSRAAAKSGAGMVRLFVERAVYTPIAAQAQSIMVVPGDELSAVSPEGYQALLVGPGWGRDPSRFALLRELVQSGLPGVLDADGLNLLADAEARGEALPDFGGQWVLTPHPGECARIAGVPVSQVMREPLKTIIGLSERLNAVCVLKSHVSYLSQPDGFYAFLDGANAALATGGGGDVLSGIVAGLLAQGAGPWDAACAALLAHSRAGMLLRTRAGWFVAEELIDATGEVLGRAALGSDRWDAVGAPGRNRGAGQTDGARGAYRSFGRNGGAGRNDGPGEAESNRDWGGSASE